MVFSSIFFLCIFLPSVLTIYHLSPPRNRNHVALGASLFFSVFCYLVILMTTIGLVRAVAEAGILGQFVFDLHPAELVGAEVLELLHLAAPLVVDLDPSGPRYPGSRSLSDLVEEGPRRDDLSTILIIGSGPIVIGQGCEFDYSGTQAVKALSKEGYRVILVNSNPATIMTDPGTADVTYIEPLTLETMAEMEPVLMAVLQRIFEARKPAVFLTFLPEAASPTGAIDLDAGSAGLVIGHDGFRYERRGNGREGACPGRGRREELAAHAGADAAAGRAVRAFQSMDDQR